MNAIPPLTSKKRNIEAADIRPSPRPTARAPKRRNAGPAPEGIETKLGGIGLKHDAKKERGAREELKEREDRDHRRRALELEEKKLSLEEKKLEVQKEKVAAQQEMAAALRELASQLGPRRA